MKSLLLVILVFTSVPILTKAQTDPSFKQDSTTLAKQLILEKLKSQIATEQKNQATTNKEDAPEKTDPNEQLKTDLERLSLLQKALGPPSVSALSGSVTISEGAASLAETRILSYKALDELLPTFVSSMTIVSNDGKACNGIPCSTSSTVLIYNASYFEALPDYKALINELTLLKSEYDKQRGEANNLGAASLVGAIALGTSVVKSLIDLVSLFKADREIKVNKESFDEEVLVSKIRKIDLCCDRKYYYPALLPPLSTSSTLTTLLSGIESARSETQKKIKDKKDEIQKNFDDEVAHANEVYKIDVAKANKEKTAIKKQQALKEAEQKKQQALKEAEQNKKSTGQKPTAIEANLQLLNERFDAIKGELAKTIESAPKMSLLRHLLRVEGILEKIDSGAYILKVSAEGKGTNIITKFLWSTTIKHSAFVEARFQLFDSHGVLIKSDATQRYSALKKSKDI